MVYVDNMPNPQMAENVIAYFFCSIFFAILKMQEQIKQKRKEVKNEILCYENGRRGHFIF